MKVLADDMDMDINNEGLDENGEKNDPNADNGYGIDNDIKRDQATWNIRMKCSY